MPTRTVAETKARYWRPGWKFTTQSASTRASAIAHRGKFTRKACGYVDDRRCRPAALPPLPERARIVRGNARFFAHIPTGTATNKG